MKPSNSKDKALREKIESLMAENHKLRLDMEKMEAERSRLEYDSFLLRTLFNASQDAIYFKDRKSRFTESTVSLAARMGVGDVRNLLGNTDYDYFRKEHADEAFRDEQRIMAGGEPVHGKVEKEIWPDGSVTWVNTSKMPVKDSQGNIIGIVGISRDITKLKNAEEQVRISEERFRSLIRHLSDMILIVDQDNRIKYASESSVYVLGMEPGELMGKDARDLMFPCELNVTMEQLARASRDENGFQPNLFRSRHAAKGWIYLDIIFNNLTGYTGIDGIVLTAREVSERIKRDEEEKKHILEIQRSNQELEQFAYAVSHDLQEPLRKIRSFAELLSKRYGASLDEKAGQYISIIVDGAQRMQILINDLLIYSRINTQAKAFTMFHMGDSLDDALSDLEIIIRETKAKVEAGRLPEIKGDRNQITRLFQNLIGNAIKFRGNAHPAIRIVSERLEKYWQISVSDNGIGIDPAYSERIFQVFQRLHSRAEYEGTGIGLALCKRIVEKHGGKIRVDSKPGKGATFIITLPTE